MEGAKQNSRKVVAQEGMYYTVYLRREKNNLLWSVAHFQEVT